MSALEHEITNENTIACIQIGFGLLQGELEIIRKAHRNQKQSLRQ